MKPLVVYDCMVFLQACVSDQGASFGCFRLVEEKRVDLLLSPAILNEIQRVLNRVDLQEKFPPLVPERIESFLHEARSRAVLVDDPPRMFPLPRDPKDEPYLDLAIATGANYLVTWNHRHLGYMMDEAFSESRDFRSRFPHLRILKPPDFLEEIRRHPV